MEIKNEQLRKAYIEVYSLFLNYFILNKKCTLASRSECTKSNETLKETFRLQSYKTFLYLANLYYTI